MAGASPPMAKTCLWGCYVNHGSWMAPQGSQLQPFPASPCRTHTPGEKGEQSQLLHTEVVSTHELLPVLSEREIMSCKITVWNSTILFFVYVFISTLKCSCYFCHLQSIWLWLIIPETIPYLFQVQFLNTSSKEWEDLLSCWLWGVVIRYLPFPLTSAGFSVLMEWRCAPPCPA